MRMKFDNENGVLFCVFLDGQYQSTAIEADEESGEIVRMVRGDDGELVLDESGSIVTETVIGIVEIIHIDDVLRENIERVY